ncbi:small subunit rRNA maturation protein LCP5 [Aspergillus glaucus CBS 516.65]|uniref:Uncharacterized protein n=1 Tax=Aspergillus glaucus CBS 516.65 TaxID=1160497 RepID=A0A1L9V445_ASPGL|nr:hypothetical protein ASPGLDRAFT_53396 [Aspergillus glaucus CBS 516.65]OJJ78714.1 hypothetical protein ASPGLDRAFT_53396 [Aspergillus glaucus CBS 516.65]
MAATATQSEAAPQDISTLLETITSCLSGTGSSLPTDASIDSPQEGISLLNTKSELLLSYLHNLVFLTIFQLKGLSSEDSAEDGEANQSLREDVVKKLTELRVYLERGVRPLEGRLKYQVDKVVKAAEDAEREGRNAPAPTKKNKTKKAPKSDSEDESGSEEASSGSEDEESKDEENIDDMAYRPNVSAFSQGVQAQAKPTKSDKTDQKAPSDGIYRPPKIMPTALPTTERREREDRRPRRSNVVDEFVNAEMSSAPTMEASIGSTIRSGGRHTRSHKEKEREEERNAYEETNFVRLPAVSKEDQKKQRGRRGAESTFGGEDWKGLTEGADRIARLTQRGKGSGSALDKSRKRKTTEDMPRGDGAGVGQIFDKRRKKVDSWKR